MRLGSKDTAKKDTAKSERLGVHRVGEMFELHDWAFVELHENDHGIDAIVDPKAEGTPLGRWVSLQVKSGPDYFKRRKSTAEGWWFVDEDDHLTYWLGLGLPVVVVLHDIESKTSYWQHVTAEKIVPTGRAWKMMVPREQVLGPRSFPALRAVAQVTHQVGADPLKASLDFLPPAAADMLRTVGKTDLMGALYVAQALMLGSEDPRSTVEKILKRISKRAGDHSQLEIAIGLYAADHEQVDLAAEAFTSGLTTPNANTRVYLQGAIYRLVLKDIEGAMEFMAEFKEKGGSALASAMVHAIVDHQGQPGSIPIPECLEQADAAELKQEPHCLMFMAEQALVRGDWDVAVTMAERAYEVLPTVSGCQVLLAQALGMRVESGSAAVPENDLRRVRELAQEAFEQRRAWRGPSEAPLLILLRRLFLDRAFAQVVRQAEASPLGLARDREACFGEVAVLGAAAAVMLGDHSKAEAFRKRVSGKPVQTTIRAMVADADPTVSDAIRISMWTAALEMDQTPGAGPPALYRLAELAALPVAVAERLLAAGEMGADQFELMLARDEAARGLVTEALARLKRGGESPDKTEIRILILQADGQIAEALQEAARGMNRYGLSTLAYRHLSLLSLTPRADDTDMITYARRLMARESTPVELRTELRRSIVALLAAKADWVSVEEESRQGLGGQPDDPELQWWLIGARWNRGLTDDAWSYFRQFGLTVQAPNQVKSWLQLHARYGFTTTDFAAALEYYERWPDAPGVQTHVILTLADSGASLTPKGSPVLPEVDSQLKERFQAALEDYTARYPDGPIKVIKASAVEIAESMRLALRTYTQRQAVLADKVRKGEIRLSVLCTELQLPYAQAFIENTCGILPAVTSDTAAFTRELAIARAALGGPVVADTSTLAVATLLDRARWKTLFDAFTEIKITRAASHDFMEARARLERDPERGFTVAYDPTTDELVRLSPDTLRENDPTQRLDSIHDAIGLATIEETPDLPGVDPENRAQGDVFLRALVLAGTRKIPLWCDDVSARTFARARGLPAFGTLALLHVLDEPGTESDVLRHDVLTLVRACVVDLFLTGEEFLALSAEEGWAPTAASTILTRRSFWADVNIATTDFLNVIDAVNTHQPQHLAAWFLAACAGLAASVESNAIEDRLRELSIVTVNRLNATGPTRDLLHDIAGRF